MKRRGEIKIHERFERRRIKIHGGIIAPAPRKQKARELGITIRIRESHS